MHLIENEEWCEFEHKAGQRFKIENVEAEIRQQTDVIAGKNSGISNEKIKLTVYSPNVLTLTVVDLPGLVKVRFIFHCTFDTLKLLL